MNKPKRDTLTEQCLLNVGFSNTVIANRIIAIISFDSAPVRRLKNEARDDKRLIDATFGRKTRSMLIMDSNHIVLSAIQKETLAQRFITLMDLQAKKKADKTIF